MSTWDQAQRAKWDNNHSEYSDGEEYSDDEEYAPLQMSSWGTQTVEEDGTTNVNLTVSGWASLIDPNFKVQANGVGSGQLHRKGAHYIPVDEQLIVDRRNGKPVPKGGLPGSKKKRGGKSKGSKAKPSPDLVPPSSSASRSNRGFITSGPWATGASLSSTPFWEVPASSTTTGTYASKYATPIPPRSNPAPPPVQSSVRAPAQVAPPRQAPIPTPVHTPTTTTNSQQPLALGSAASKYATPQPVQKPAYQAPPPVTQHQTTQPATVYHKLDTPVINFTIELTAGVKARLQVYENDVPEQVVDQFEKDHHLVMEDSAKRVFAKKIENLLEQYRNN